MMFICRNEDVTVSRPIDLKKAGVVFLTSISILIFFVTLSTAIVKVLLLVLRMNSTTVRDLLSEIETHNGHEVIKSTHTHKHTHTSVVAMK